MINNKSRSHYHIIKVILFWSVLTFIILISREPINEFIVEHIKYFEFDKILTKVLFFILFVISVLFLIKTRKIANCTFTLHLFFACILYTLFRINVIEHDDWNFVSLFGVVDYCSIIWLLFAISFILDFWLLLRNRKAIEINHNLRSFFSDNNPIESKEKDLFGYSEDAESLLNIIVDNNTKAANGAVIIGLSGKWGSGKTSYLNLMKDASLQRQDVILVRFNVWQSHSYEDMAQKLFSSIANGIGDISINSLINDYLQVVVDADISYLSKIVKALFGRKKKQPEVLFKAVSKKIQRLNKTLVVQIDDLDRLTAEEVLYTLKFIRNIANFKHTFFIVAYDEEYLKKQFDKLNIDYSYLEKIFNITYPLPCVRRDYYIDIVKKELIGSLLIDVEVESTVEKFLEVIAYHLTLRNAKRLASSIQSGLSMLKDEDGEITVNLLDYMLVQYLQQINRQAYDFLANFKDDEHIIKTKSIKLDGLFYTLNTDKGSFVKPEQMTDEEYLKRLTNDIGENNLKLTYKIFKTLFDTSRKTILGFSYINSFPLYFNRVFDRKLITKKEFSNSFNKGKEVFIENLKQWHKNNDRPILSRLIANYPCNSEAEWISLFESTLCLTPKSFIDFRYNHLWAKEWDFIPTPAINTLAYGTKDERTIICNAIYNFFLDSEVLALDSKEIIQRKFALFLNNRREYFDYAALSYWKKKKYNTREVFELYWNLYLQKGASYKDFDNDFWHYIDYIVYDTDKIELRGIAQNHIKVNIEEFMMNYPIDCMSSYPNMHSLFKEYAVVNNSIHSSEEWMQGFYDFLNTIPDKSPTLVSYIKAFEEYVKSQNKSIKVVKQE